MRKLFAGEKGAIRKKGSGAPLPLFRMACQGIAEGGERKTNAEVYAEVRRPLPTAADLTREVLGCGADYCVKSLPLTNRNRSGQEGLAAGFLEVAKHDLRVVDFGHGKFFKDGAVAGDPGGASFDLTGGCLQTGQKEGENLKDGKDSNPGC
jgi:hypothetical protein